ncbi:AAA family ATPase [Jiella pelagia]|uniref:AAA family ATPase n=1 Tax=Jiella pelagia TaxID=2986949 RepID=A0ABY7C5B1_9HYPH|nr:AAA family ATPase [Jiella pelagia]WAP69020.1 AAA family ATPase [Jiella pelagia]
MFRKLHRAIMSVGAFIVNPVRFMRQAARQSIKTVREVKQQTKAETVATRTVMTDTGERITIPEPEPIRPKPVSENRNTSNNERGPSYPEPPYMRPQSQSPQNSGTHANHAATAQSAKPRKRPEDILAEINSMVGLAEVKKEMQSLFYTIKSQEARRKAGTPSKVPGRYHLALLGNPGTGKTTVARKISQFYHAAHIVRTSKFREVAREELLGKYQGHTEDLMKNLVADALDGVLFIDEAHNLFMPGSDTDYGKHVIHALIRAMENHRDRLVVILAGYPRPMERFLTEGDPGLDRRIRKRITFADYSLEELIQIFYISAASEGFRVHDSARSSLINAVKDVSDKRTATFGNASEMEKLVTRCVDMHGERIHRRDIAADNWLMPEDFPLK